MYLYIFFCVCRICRNTRVLLNLYVISLSLSLRNEMERIEIMVNAYVYRNSGTDPVGRMYIRIEIMVVFLDLQRRRVPYGLNYYRDCIFPKFPFSGISGYVLALANI